MKVEIPTHQTIGHLYFTNIYLKVTCSLELLQPQQIISFNTLVQSRNFISRSVFFGSKLKLLTNFFTIPLSAEYVCNITSGDL